MKFLSLVPVVLFALTAQSATKAKNTITYFSCKVMESVGEGKKAKQVEVTVKFAVKNLDMYKPKGELVQYPGLNEEDGYISITPAEIAKDKPAAMGNLNAQGGDLRVDDHNIQLWGDGDGYLFTDLTIWDVDDSEDGDVLDGYVREYGSAYNKGDEKFKQFIKCQRSDKQL